MTAPRCVSCGSSAADLEFLRSLSGRTLTATLALCCLGPAAFAKMRVACYFWPSDARNAAAKRNPDR